MNIYKNIYELTREDVSNPFKNLSIGELTYVHFNLTPDEYALSDYVFFGEGIYLLILKSRHHETGLYKKIK